VGTQLYSSKSAVYSYLQPIVTPGLELTYDPDTNAFTAGKIADCVLLT
jgi:hypothetical protein